MIMKRLIAIISLVLALWILPILALPPNAPIDFNNVTKTIVTNHSHDDRAKIATPQQSLAAIQSCSQSTAELVTPNHIDCLPIIMYHSINNRTDRYVLGVGAFENDLKFLKEQGYTTLTISDIINYQNHSNTRLPAKPIILTFDDGYYNNYFVVFPLLKEYGMKGVISVVGEFCDREETQTIRHPYYSIMNYRELKEMTDSGVFEVQNHSYNFHHVKNGRQGIKNNPNENLEEYKNLLKTDTINMQNKIKEKTGKIATCYTYPYGGYSKISNEVLIELGFRCTLTCNEGLNYISKTSSLISLKRLERKNTRPLSVILSERKASI